MNFKPSISGKTLSSALATLAHFANHKVQVNESGGGLKNKIESSKNRNTKAERVRLWRATGKRGIIIRISEC